MSQTVEYIHHLVAMKEGERSLLRSLGGQPLDARLDGFDLFTGLWWPLRQASLVAPRRETSWLVAKLFATYRVPHVRPDSGSGPTLPAVLGLCEPRRFHCRDAAPLSSPTPEREPAKSEFIAARKFRTRFDALLCSPLPALEPHLRWALGEVAKAVHGRIPHARSVQGIDWAWLLDELSLWDRGYNPGDTHQKHRLTIHSKNFRCGETHTNPQDLWACEYLARTGSTRQGA